MSGDLLALPWEALPIGLALLTLLLFAAATWTGRWRLWLAGWTAAVIALVTGILMRGGS